MSLHRSFGGWRREALQWFFFFFVKGDNATQAHALLYSTGRVLLLNQYVKVWPGAGGGKLSHRRWWWMGHQADTDIAVTSQAHR